MSSPPFQELAALPLNRLKKAESFNVTGVDFARPLYYKPVVSKKAKRQKVSSRPLNYIGEGADDPLPITPNQFLNNRRSTCATPEPAVNLLARTSTSVVLVELDKERREYVSKICFRFIEDYVMQLDNFQTNGRYVLAKSS
jgi:hypothetical protein